MLVLASLNKLLSRALAPPVLHTAVLFTSTGALVSFASATIRPKDDIRVLVGLASEVWAETRDEGEGIVESELGHIVVLPVASLDKGRKTEEPILLIALIATEDIEWGDLQRKGHSVATFLRKPLQQLQDKLSSLAPPAGKTARR